MVKSHLVRASRTDLEQIWDSIKRGELKTPEEICDLNPSAYVRYSRSFDRLLGFSVQKRSWKTEVISLWGDAGAGKSRQVAVMELVSLGNLSPSEVDIDNMIESLDWVTFSGDRYNPFISGYTGCPVVVFVGVSSSTVC